MKFIRFHISTIMLIVALFFLSSCSISGENAGQQSKHDVNEPLDDFWKSVERDCEGTNKPDPVKDQCKALRAWYFAVINLTEHMIENQPSSELNTTRQAIAALDEKYRQPSKEAMTNLIGLMAQQGNLHDPGIDSIPSFIEKMNRTRSNYSDSIDFDQPRMLFLLTVDLQYYAIQEEYPLSSAHQAGRANLGLAPETLGNTLVKYSTILANPTLQEAMRRDVELFLETLYPHPPAHAAAMSIRNLFKGTYAIPDNFCASDNGIVQNIELSNLSRYCSQRAPIPNNYPQSPLEAPHANDVIYLVFAGDNALYDALPDITSLRETHTIAFKSRQDFPLTIEKPVEAISGSVPESWKQQATHQRDVTYCEDQSCNHYEYKPDGSRRHRECHSCRNQDRKVDVLRVYEVYLIPNHLSFELNRYLTDGKDLSGGYSSITLYPNGDQREIPHQNLIP